MSAAKDVSDRLARIDVTLLTGKQLEKNDFIARFHLDESAPVEFGLNPTTHKRIELAVGDLVLSIGFQPPQPSYDAGPEPVPQPAVHIRRTFG